MAKAASTRALVTLSLRRVMLAMALRRPQTPILGHGIRTRRPIGTARLSSISDARVTATIRP